MEQHIAAIPAGYSEVFYNGRKYGLRRTDFNQGKSTKIYARELGGKDYISFNYYYTDKGGRMKTCEMPAKKIYKFLQAYTLS